ncbi:hypothetical protein [Herbaspirillum huttiense]|uniref:hypothetical protein n=1 Tax=Herbaspirillum huttiense TaxID=863372 RepID=UPI0031DF5F44
MPSKHLKKSGGLSGKLLAVAPEYRFAVYKQLEAKRRAKKPQKGSPVLPGSFENGKKR